VGRAPHFVAMAANYGATGQSAAVQRTLTKSEGSFDLYDSQEDEEYEYLPLPDIDENFLDNDNTDGSRREGSKQRLFVNSP
jgi:hypothetical protein